MEKVEILDDALYDMCFLRTVMHCNVPTLNRMCRVGEIPNAKKIGRYWQITGKNLKKYLNNEV